MQTQYEKLMYAAKVIKALPNASAVAAMLTRNGYEVSPQVLNNWKSRGLSYEAIVRCSQIIGCPAGWLLDGEGDVFKAGASALSEADRIAASLSENQLSAWLEIGRLLIGANNNP
jgi:hypothetical protein